MILLPKGISHCKLCCKNSARGIEIGKQFVVQPLKVGKKLGFRVLQFNAVVSSNTEAIYLYEKLGFVRLGIVPNGFLLKDNTYEDIILFYHTL